MTKGVTFYFVRHGETYLNRLGRFQGWADAPLTQKAWKLSTNQAVALRTSNSMRSTQAIWVGLSKRLRFY